MNADFRMVAKIQRAAVFGFEDRADDCEFADGCDVRVFSMHVDKGIDGTGEAETGTNATGSRPVVVRTDSGAFSGLNYDCRQRREAADLFLTVKPDVEVRRHPGR